MKTPYIEIDESLGQLRHISMPSQDVYHLTLVSPLIDELTLGPPKEIYAIPQNYAGKVISKRALAFGQKHGQNQTFLEQFQAREIIPPPTVPAETFLHLPE